MLQSELNSMDISHKEFSIAGYKQRLMSADLHFDPHNKEMSIVIYAHGINGFKDWGGMNLIAQKFAEKQLAFLKFNFSLNGTTPESPTDFVDLEAYAQDNYTIRQHELKLLTDFVSSQPFPFSVKEIYLIGHSRGGTDVILYAPRDKRIKKLISWAAVSMAKTPWQHWDSEQMIDWKNRGVQYRKNGRTGQDMPIGYQLYEDYINNRKRLDVEAAAHQISIPWLIVHGEDDEAVFIKEAYNLRQWNPHASVAIIPATGHTFGRSHPWNKPTLPPASEALVKESIRFLKK